MSCATTCDGATVKRLRLIFTAVASLAAALLSHFVIDLLGDVLLAHDSYDDIAHGSRALGAVAAGLGLMVTLAFALRAALSEARGSEGVLLALLRGALPRSPWRHWIAITLSSLGLVAAMEACDAIVAGLPCDDIVELFGGSFWLATAVTAAVGALVSIAQRALLRRLTQLHALIVAIVVAIVAVVVAALAPSSVVRSFARRTYAPAAALGASASGRAPPHVPSLVSL